VRSIRFWSVEWTIFSVIDCTVFPFLLSLGSQLPLSCLHRGLLQLENVFISFVFFCIGWFCFILPPFSGQGLTPPSFLNSSDGVPSSRAAVSTHSGTGGVCPRSFSVAVTTQTPSFLAIDEGPTFRGQGAPCFPQAQTLRCLLGQLFSYFLLFPEVGCLRWCVLKGRLGRVWLVVP